MIRDLLDEEGENRAVRSFLMQYSCDRAITVGAMLAHMNRSGWREAAPAFSLEVRPETHLSKAGAQIWIRHLFSLESAAPTAGEPSTDELMCVGQEFLQWNRAQPTPPVAACKELYVARKVLELRAAHIKATAEKDGAA